jgi:hypothetical protein
MNVFFKTLFTVVETAEKHGCKNKPLTAMQIGIKQKAPLMGFADWTGLVVSV